jgi:GntR family transcriptional regulator
LTTRIPRYQQIAETLRRRIRRGRLAAGDRLDTQRRLAAEFGVTLMTVRQALDGLEREGLIARRHGLGTFVAAPSVDYDILHVQSLAGAFGLRGAEVTTRFLRRHWVAADRGVADALGGRRGERVLVLERLRLLGVHPISYQASFLPPALGEEVAQADLGTTPLRQVLSFKLGVEIASARETVSAVGLEAGAARELGCRPGRPSFRSDRVSLDAAGRPVVYDRVFIPGDRFRITREITFDPRASDPGRELSSEGEE